MSKSYVFHFNDLYIHLISNEILLFFLYVLPSNIIHNNYNDDNTYHIHKSYIFCSLVITAVKEANVISRHHLFDNL